jgi:hypothetical protein
VRQHGDDLVAVPAHEPGGEAGADPVREQERLDLPDRRHLTPGRNFALDASPRDRAPGLRAHLTQPFRPAVELGEDLLRTEVVDDRTREGRANPGHASHQPERDPLRRLPQCGAERLDRELPAVPWVLQERPGADELLAGGHVAERARDRDRLAFATLADRRRPDGELQVGRDVARPRLSERDLDLAGFRVGRRRRALGLPHAADDTSRPLTPSSRSVLHSKGAHVRKGAARHFETPLETRIWFVDAIPLQIARFDGMTEFLNPTRRGNGGDRQRGRPQPQRISQLLRERRAKYSRPRADIRSRASTSNPLDAVFGRRRPNLGRFARDAQTSLGN